MKLCVFVHYSIEAKMPYYVQCYLTELVRFFDQVIMVTNSRQLDEHSYSSVEGVDLMTVPNEGYDFGMFYKVMQSMSIEKYETIACVNDSNLLVKKLDSVFSWKKEKDVELWSLIDSYEKPWFATHENSYHLQSFFLVFEKPAIELLPSFFDSLQLEEIYAFTDPKLLKNRVINDWEIGLTQFMIDQGVKIGSYIDSKSFAEMNRLPENKNLTMKFYKLLLSNGYPLLKKNLINKKRFWDRFSSDSKNKWKALFCKFGSTDWDAEKMINQ